jgi:hypothetical protein
MSDKKCGIEMEIESLNLDHLDVDELEHRLEMATAMPDPNLGNQCGVDCYINTP